MKEDMLVKRTLRKAREGRGKRYVENIFEP
jgi:hypothetical protein